MYLYLIRCCLKLVCVGVFASWCISHSASNLIFFIDKMNLFLLMIKQTGSSPLLLMNAVLCLWHCLQQPCFSPFSPCLWP